MARPKKKQKNNVAMAIEKLDFDALINFATQNRCKRDLYSFQDEFKNRPESDIALIISNLCKMVISCMEKFLAGNCSTPDVTNCNIAGKLIQVAVDIAIATLQLNFQMQCHVEIAILLNGILPAVPKSQDGVKNSIAQFCEKLCLLNFSDKSEYFLFNVLPYLLQRTLRTRVYKADIKRIYAIRHKLGTIMELKETPKGEIWELFKKCSLSQAYLLILEGQKLIALSMTLDIDKLTEIHKVIMRALPTINIKFAAPYGKIYFEAWCYCLKTRKPAIKNVLEITCLQDLILAAIRGGNKPILPITRKILSQFHINKKDEEVSKTLYYLYQPLLWRFLKNPDGHIRANATQLFLDIFPLENPEVKVVATDLELNDQLLMIRDLLVDDFPIVRITTVIGICVSMSVNWEVYPEEMLRTYFRIIVNDLSRDSASSEVRCAVVKGLKCLLENPLSMNCLIGILPKMGGLFHDVCENVRVAFCQLLLRVKTISAIKFFDIVPTTHLLARLQEDCYVVKKSISNLLNNSYFPRNEGPKVWLGRCLEIMKKERKTTRVLFSHVGYFIGIESSVRFIIQAIKAVHIYVKTKNSPATANGKVCNGVSTLNRDEYMSSLEEAVGFSNLQVVSTVMESIAVLWLSLNLGVEEPENKYFLKMLVSKVGQPLADLCLYYKDTEVWEPLFYISSFLPPASVPSLASLCFWKLKNLSSDAQPHEYITLLESLCNQQQSVELFNLIKEWIEVGLYDPNIPPSTKKRRKTKSIENIHVEEPKPYLANQMLSSIISHRCMQKAILKQASVLRDLIHLVDDIKRKLEQPSTRQISEADSSFLSLLLHNIIKLSVLLHDDDCPGNIKFLDETVKWAEEKLLEHLTFSTETPENFANLVFTICQNLAQVVADVVALGYCDSDSDIYLSFFEKLLRSGMGNKFALLTTRFLYKNAASGMYICLMDKDTIMLELLTKSLCNVFDIFCNEAFLQTITNEENIQTMLANVIQVIHNLIVVLPEPISQVFQCVLKIILDSVVENITTNIVEEFDDDPFNKISFPRVGAFFLIIVNMKPKFIPTYIKNLNEIFSSSNKDISLWIANWAVIYNILNTKEPTKPILKAANILILNLGNTIHEIYPRKKISERSISEKPAESPQMQIFQRHCHAEFLKLKSCLFSKISALKKAKK